MMLEISSMRAIWIPVYIVWAYHHQRENRHIESHLNPMWNSFIKTVNKHAHLTCTIYTYVWQTQIELCTNIFSCICPPVIWYTYINIYKIVLIFELIPGTLGKLFETIEFPGMNELQIFGAECGFNGKFSL